MRKHAIIIGSGIAGLGAARVLSKYFENVTVIERDTLEDNDQPRPGVPQGNHIHILLVAGRQIIEEYYPGIMDQLIAEGAVKSDICGDNVHYAGGTYYLRTDIGLDFMSMTRPFLENKIRQYVRKLSNVKFLEKVNAIEPVYTEERVVGLKIKDLTTNEVRTLEADLVIDAEGRASQSPVWLASIGYGNVEKTSIKIDLGYTSMLFERKPGDLHNNAYGNFVNGKPPGSRRIGLMSAVENDRWIVAFQGILGDYPPTDLEGIREFARSLPAPSVYDLVKDREPVTEIKQFVFKEYTRKHFERMQRFPKGFLVIGDAMCSLNPIYGQGMSAAMCEVKALDESLAEGDDDLAKRYFNKASKVIDIPWMMVISADLMYPQVEGPRPWWFGLYIRYIERLHYALSKDPVLLKRYAEVINMVREPSSLLSFDSVWRVLLKGGKASQEIPKFKV